MTANTRHPALARRAALLAGLAALPGCSIYDSIFGTDKKKLPGERQPVLVGGRALADATTARSVTLPPPVATADWPMPGGTPAHEGGNLALPGGFNRAWTASIGESSGYRRRITAQPVVAGGRVFTMDADGVVAAFDAAGGRSQWRTVTEPPDDRSTNVGGGIAVAGDTVFAATGRAEILALEAATGAVRWRAPLGAPARSAPTIAADRLYVGTLDNQMLGLSASDGKRLWSYQSPASDTVVLGMPAPAYVDGIVIAGFGSGELAALRAASGTVAWSDSLAASRGRTSIADLSAIRGMPMTRDGRVYAASYGGQLLANDLRSGRRLWELEVASSEAPWIAGDWLFVVGTDAMVAAVNRADGAVAWTSQLEHYANPEKQKEPITWAGPVLAGGRLFLGNSLGTAVLLDPANGAVAGTFPLPGALTLAPVVAGGTMYMVTDNATLLALR
ncbi:MAG: PQQ-binding-like beta-propeller repeat protein [Acetobacteraceae bacterium]|nr:PQQ-binding-like beta-propeller repeat protein [Acetobacteraceae bacterium]